MTGFVQRLAAALADASTPSANLVFSPASISIALAMIRDGAAGATADQIDELLIGVDPVGAARALRGLARAVPTADADAEIVVSAVNALFAQRDYEIGQPFLQRLDSNHDCAVHLMDFSADPERSRVEINAVIDDRTGHRIPELLPRGAISPETRLSVVNTISLEAAWRFPFAAALTADAPFTCLGGAKNDVPTMHLVAALPYATGDGWRAIELPYRPGSASLLIVLPDVGRSVGTAMEIVTAPSFSTRARLAVSLPRFAITTSVLLADSLRALGMTNAFDLATADFRAITTSEPLCIGEVAHQANISVDEKGTEASAATAVAMVGMGRAPEPPIEFCVDRPFVFALRHIDSETILFVGHVGDPTSPNV